jgi:hypothetical protein
VWALVDRFQSEESLVKLSLLQAARGQGSPEDNKSRNIRKSQRDTEFKEAVANFGKVPIDLHMKNLINFFD